ncbi:MAG: MFS transporter [Candidatus Dormibacteraceae bacterium]
MAREQETDAGGPSPPPRRFRLGGVVIDTAPLRYVPFRRLWMTGIVTAVGSQLTAVAVPKQIYDLTGSSAMVGVSGAVALVPLIVFGLWGGAIADAVDRRQLLFWSNAGIAATSLLLAVQSFAGNRSVLIVFVLLALQQALFGINQPTRSAAIARLVPLTEIPSANALMSTVLQFGLIAGPLLAGALIPVLGVPLLYAIDTVGLTVMLWSIWRLPAIPPVAGQRSRTGIGPILDGFRYLAPRGVLLVSFLADLIAMIFGMPRALFPQLAATTFSGAGSGVAPGLLYAAIPIGSFAGGLFSGTFVRRRRAGVVVAFAVGGWGAAIVAFGLSRSLWEAAAFLALAGVADLISMVLRGAILQQAAVDEMRGRMQGVFTVVVAGGPRLADLLHGVLGAAIGTRATIAGGGILVIVLLAAVLVAFPAFWHYRAPVGDAATGVE